LIIKYDGLDADYLFTDGSIPEALHDSAVLLSSGVDQSVSLSGYDKIAVVYEGDAIAVDFLEILGTQSTESSLSIIADTTASSGYALKIEGAQTLVFATKISYITDVLKKVTIRAKKDDTNTTETLSASVVAYKNGQFINRDGDPTLTDFLKIAAEDATLTTSYVNHVGYFKNTGASYVEPANDPNDPCPLPENTDEISLLISTDGGIFYVDFITLEEVENTIRDIPDGEYVYDGAVNFDTRNDRISTTPADPTSVADDSYTINDDGSVDIVFTWEFTDPDPPSNAYNIDGFAIYLSSAMDNTAPSFTESDGALYVDASTRSFTLRSVTANKYHTIGVQAYRYIDHDVAEDLALTEDIIRSAIVESTPYQVATIIASTTTFRIKENVNDYADTPASGYVYLHGFHPNGSGADIAGRIVFQDTEYTIPASDVDCSDFTLTADKTFIGYLILDDGAVECFHYDISDGSLKNDSGSADAGIVIGEVTVEYTHDTTSFAISASLVYTEAKVRTKVILEQNLYALNYLNEATDSEDFGDRATELGIENVFTTLAAYTAFINRLFVANLTIGTGDYTAESGFGFRVHTYDDEGVELDPRIVQASIDDKNLFKIVVDDSDPDGEEGDVIIGPYNPDTKTGGIFYDASEDKLLGNVAYDQWDLVIESDADLALLHDRTAWATATVYSLNDKIKNDGQAYICISAHTSGDEDDEPGTGVDWEDYWKEINYFHIALAPGTYTTDVGIDLSLYQSTLLIGIGNVTINIDYDFDSGSIFLFPEGMKEVGGFAIRYVHASNPSSALGCILDIRDVLDIYLHNIYICGFNNYGYGIRGTQGVQLAQVGESRIDNVKIDDTNYGFFNVMRLHNCTTYSCLNIGYTHCIYLSTCFSSYNYTGYDYCKQLNTCVAQDNGSAGFSRCEYLTVSRAVSNTDEGFYLCYYLSSCFAGENADGMYLCTLIVGCELNGNTTYGLTVCQNIAGTKSSGSGSANWNACTSVDYDSCDAISSSVTTYSYLAVDKLIQWGLTGDIDADDYETVTFPLAFNSTPYLALATMNQASGSNYRTATVSNIGATTMRVHNDGVGTGKAYWIAIGSIES
jgi:hypothetical protein